MSVQVGIVLEVNQKPVSLIPQKTVQDLKKHGMKLELKERLNLGKIGEGIDGIVGKFSEGFSIDEMTNKLPEVLDRMVDKFLDLSLIVEEFYLFIPGSETEAKDGEKPKTLYTVGMSFIWEDKPLEILTNALAVKGIYLKVSNREESNEEVEIGTEGENIEAIDTGSPEDTGNGESNDETGANS